MKKEFETGTCYPVIWGQPNGGYAPMNRCFDYVSGECLNEYDFEFTDCYPFGEAPDYIQEEILLNANAYDIEAIRHGEVYEVCDEDDYSFVATYGEDD